MTPKDVCSPWWESQGTAWGGGGNFPVHYLWYFICIFYIYPRKSKLFLNDTTCNVSWGSYIKSKEYSSKCFSQSMLVPCHSDWPLLESPSNWPPSQTVTLSYPSELLSAHIYWQPSATERLALESKPLLQMADGTLLPHLFLMWPSQSRCLEAQPLRWCGRSWLLGAWPLLSGPFSWALEYTSVHVKNWLLKRQ